MYVAAWPEEPIYCWEYKRMSSVPAVPTGIGGEQQYLQVWSCSWAWGIQAKGCDGVEISSPLFCSSTVLRRSKWGLRLQGSWEIHVSVTWFFFFFFTVLVAFYVACTGIEMSVRAANCLFAVVQFGSSQGCCRTVAVLEMTHSSLAVGLAVYPRAKSPLCCWSGSKVLPQKRLPVPSKTLFPDMLRHGVQQCPSTRVAQSHTTDHGVCVFKEHVCTGLF